MQQVETGKYWQGDRLRQLIGDLRAEPDSDLKTLRRIETKLTELSGVRLTIGRARAVDARVSQARVLAAGLAPTRAAQRICEALNVSHSTSWRYLKRIKNA